MNNKYTYNKFSMLDNINTSLSIEKKDDEYIIQPRITYQDGNLNKQIFNNIDAILDKSHIARPNTIEQYYQSKYCKYPITPLEHNEGLQKWENKQPIKYDNNKCIKFSNEQYPIELLNSYRILGQYDNSDMYSHYFFTQKDGRLNNRY